MMTFQKDFPLDRLTTFGCRSVAANYAEIRSTAELKEALALAAEQGLRVHILGGGANTIARSRIEGVVLRIAIGGYALTAINDDEALITAGAGEVFDEVIARSIGGGYSGLENLSAIPGTVGGAVVQNIGAYGVELAEHLVSVRIWDREQQTERVLSLADCDFSYRHSVFKTPKASQWIILSAVLRVRKTFTPVMGYKDVEHALGLHGLSIEDLTPVRMSSLIREIRARKLPDPAVTGNAGSFFTNPIVDKVVWRRVLVNHPSVVHYRLGGGRMKFAAASLIETAGLKGFRAEKVGVSANHALILENLGGASGEDVLEFAAMIQQKIEEKFGVRLVMEPVVL